MEMIKLTQGQTLVISIFSVTNNEQLMRNTNKYLWYL